MGTSTPPVIASAGISDPVALKRQHWSVKLKRQIVEETLMARGSVARVARAHGVNANQVFYWRKLYREGLLGSGSNKLLPVRIEPADPVGDDLEDSPSGTAQSLIQIKLNGAQIRIEGSPDRALLRTILELLRG